MAKGGSKFNTRHGHILGTTTKPRRTLDHTQQARLIADLGERQDK